MSGKYLHCIEGVAILILSLVELIFEKRQKYKAIKFHSLKNSSLWTASFSVIKYKSTKLWKKYVPLWM